MTYLTGPSDPGKGSYWRVDLNEPHSTSRVRNRKKPSRDAAAPGVNAMADGRDPWARQRNSYPVGFYPPPHVLNAFGFGSRPVQGAAGAANTVGAHGDCAASAGPPYFATPSLHHVWQPDTTNAFAAYPAFASMPYPFPLVDSTAHYAAMHAPGSHPWPPPLAFGVPRQLGFPPGRMISGGEGSEDDVAQERTPIVACHLAQSGFQTGQDH
jgi:hypothetical protein